MKRLLLCCIAILAIASDGTAEPMQLTVNGQVRTFQLERPAGQGPRPAIIMLHGGGGTAEQELRLPGLAQLGQREGFLVVFPEAKGGLWNFFPPGKETLQYVQFFQHLGGLPDDVAFLRMLVADLVQSGGADAKRVYLAGRSLGGVMALRLACVDAGTFAAIGLLISAMPEATGSDCHPRMSLPIVMVNGTEDRILPYKGERSPQGEILWSTDRLVSFFSDLNGCPELMPQSWLRDGRAQSLVVERSIRCPGGSIMLYSIVGGGHDIPPAVNAAQTLLDFFRDKVR